MKPLKANMTKRHTFFGSFAFVILVAMLALFHKAARAEFTKDLAALTAAPHRLAGTAEGTAAARYVAGRLREIGLDEVVTQAFPVWQTHVTRCELVVDGTTLALQPLRPNLVVPPTTPEGGITGRLIYVGRGELSDYGQRDAAGAVVVLDYDSFDAWHRAFALGASAVVFLDQGPRADAAVAATIPPDLKHTSLPANQPRFYIDATEAEAAGVDLTRNRESVTLLSEVTWRLGVGHNVVGVLRGTAPKFAAPGREAGESVVLAANLDSFGTVPTRSPGARSAANVAALLDAAQTLRSQPPKRDVIFLFVDNQARYHAGAREFYDALFTKHAEHERLTVMHLAEQERMRAVRQLLTSGEPTTSEATVADDLSLQGLLTPPGTQGRELMLQMLRQAADWTRDDLAKEVQILRLGWLDQGRAPPLEEQQAIQAEYDRRLARLADVQRALHNKDLPGLIRDFVDAPADDDATRGDRAAYRRTLTGLVRATVARVDRRLEELDLLTRMDRERGELREAVRGTSAARPGGDTLTYITLHASYNLGDASGVWGPVVGDWSQGFEGWQKPISSADSPGAYGRLMAALRDAGGGASARWARDFATAWTLDPPTLSEPTQGLSFVGGPFVHSGAIAGGYSIPNLAFMTGHDALIRDGHPIDTVEHLDADRLRQQADQVTALTALAIDSPGLSLDRSFSYQMASKRPGWVEGTRSGDYASLRVSGGLSENRPASDALIAVWPGPKNFGGKGQAAWSAALAEGMPGFDPIVLEAVDQHGGFRLISFRTDVADEIATVAATFDDTGRVQAITSLDTLIHLRGEAIRTDLFVGRGGMASYMQFRTLDAGAFKVIKAGSDTPLRVNQTLHGLLPPDLFFYTAAELLDNEIKLFEPSGPTVLGEFTREHPTGTGVKASTLRGGSRLSPSTAVDAWTLNESRLAQLRARSVSRVDLERVHARAGRVLEDAGRDADAAEAEAGVADTRERQNQSLEALTPQGGEVGGGALEGGALEGGALEGGGGVAPALPGSGNPSQAVISHGGRDAQPTTPTASTPPPAARSLASREAALQRSTALSFVVYPALRQTMNDLVWAVVVLLLLAIPFAFAMERLAIGASSIYGRIGGFFVIFLVTFGLLYMMHPGFAVASTPVIIFLAFAILLLSSLVIYILVRKFKTELGEIQGQGHAAHAAEASQFGTMLAAVSMGMSTMRRRPTRTILTAVTVVALTFTIMSFASFGAEIGVKRDYLGAAGGDTPQAVLVRELDYSAIEPGVLDVVRGEAGVYDTAATGSLGGAVVLPQYWRVRRGGDEPQIVVARPDTGESLTLKGVMGLDPRELSAWAALGEALEPMMEGEGEMTNAAGASASGLLESDRVLLPPIVRDELGLVAGDTVLLSGRPVVYGGAFDPGAVQRLVGLDGQSVLPVNFEAAAAAAAAAGGVSGGGTTDDLGLAEDVEQDFEKLSPDSVAVVHNDLARRLGADLHLVSVYPLGSGDGSATPATGADPVDLAERVAQVTALPVWVAGPQGIERMLLTLLTSVQGGWALTVPLLLGGLIIFGTLLGSIQDREREIYTFSALGLSPGHVGALFFAEAAVYAVVGGMGGQLLAQFVALAAAQLASLGLISPPNINYSSSNSLFALGVVMLTVIISAAYPAYRASKSANPGLARSWKPPKAEGDLLTMTFPFTVSAYDITGVVSFLAEHFRRHDDSGLGRFAASDVGLRRDRQGHLVLDSDLALAPFDLGVTQRFSLTAVPSQIPGVDEVAITAQRTGGTRGDWQRLNRVFLADLRKQFLLWRTLSAERIEDYRMETLQNLGEAQAQPPPPPLDNHAPQGAQLAASA